MSDLLQAAAAALETPTELVQRSAAARAEANGTSVDEVLSAWAGGEAVAAAAPGEAGEEAAEEAEVAAPEAEPEPAESEPAPEPEPAPDAEPEPSVAAAVAVAEPEPELEPVSLGERLRAAVRVGAWTGSALGLLAFVVAGAAWATAAAAPPDSGPVVQVDSNAILIGASLVSIVFGAIVATLSRTAAAWANPGMQLSSSPASTAWMGAALGLVLGAVAGVMLTTGFGSEIEGAEGLIQLPVLPTLFVLLLGGGLLGSITAAVPQLVGTPLAVGEEEAEEIESVRSRLRDAIGVPVAGTILLLVLVLPFAVILFQSNHLASGGAALVAILTAGGILGFSALAGNRPQMRISFGELMVAVTGIGIVVLIIVAVLYQIGR